VLGVNCSRYEQRQPGRLEVMEVDRCSRANMLCSIPVKLVMVSL